MYVLQGYFPAHWLLPVLVSEAAAAAAGRLDICRDLIRQLRTSPDARILLLESGHDSVLAVCDCPNLVLTAMTADERTAASGGTSHVVPGLLPAVRGTVVRAWRSKPCAKACSLRFRMFEWEVVNVEGACAPAAAQHAWLRCTNCLFLMSGGRTTNYITLSFLVLGGVWREFLSKFVAAAKTQCVNWESCNCPHCRHCVLATESTSGIGTTGY